MPSFNMDGAPSMMGGGDLIGAGIAGIGSVIGASMTNAANLEANQATNASNLQATRETNAANQTLAHNQMAFQEGMANTAYQRSMADMKKAGLNPMLAYSQGGAQSPSGTSIANQAPHFDAPHFDNVIGPGIASALDLSRTIASLKSTEAQNQNINVDTAIKEQRLIGEGINNTVLGQTAKKAGLDTGILEKLAPHLVKKGIADSQVAQSSVPRAEAASAIDKSYYGQKIRPWLMEVTSRLGDIFHGTSSAQKVMTAPSIQQIPDKSLIKETWRRAKTK